ncbi:unnamed protein product [Ilex paraguariensis]|uniref:Ribosome biogenesis protein BMS1/TSR1 C-terminal domain-containing protein n=1 Tax=Ilex paraguariensis TaxID=185542 RepID=A0ABC8SGH2_9AQUA
MKKKLGEGLGGDNVNIEDCSKFTNRASLNNWRKEEFSESICDRFVTGDWSKAARRGQVSEADSVDDDDDEVFGDFQDMETGEKFESHQTSDNGDDHVIHKDNDVTIEERRLEKLALQSPDEENDNKQGTKFHRNQATESGFVDKLKEEIELRKQLNIAELNDIDEATRLEIEGYRTGTYLRLEIHGVQCEMVEHFDPCHPILVGGIGLGEENVGYMQVRFKRHRWHKKVLRTRDPIIVSIGWRRYQTTPIYAIEDCNGRHRMLKYTPEHMHCLAMFWGPLAPPNTGVVAVQNLSNNQVRLFFPLFHKFPT